MSATRSDQRRDNFGGCHPRIVFGLFCGMTHNKYGVKDFRVSAGKRESFDFRPQLGFDSWPFMSADP